MFSSLTACLTISCLLKYFKIGWVKQYIVYLHAHLAQKSSEGLILCLKT